MVLRGLADDSTLGQLKDKVSESVPDFPPAEQKCECLPYLILTVKELSCVVCKLDSLK